MEVRIQKERQEENNKYGLGTYRQIAKRRKTFEMQIERGVKK